MSTYFARTDSATANNAALNLTGAPAIEIGFVPLTSSPDGGDLFLEQDAGGLPDQDTQVSIAGTLYSFRVDFIGTLPTTNSDGAGQVPAAFRGEVVVRITVLDYPAPGQTLNLVLLPEATATQQDMNAFGTGRIGVQDFSTTVPDVPVCLAAGTLVQTPRGEVAVQRLRPGDLVMTCDAGPQPVLWIGCTRHDWPGSDDRGRPVLIPAGALAPGVPARDLIVSPQHRVLIGGATAEVLVPALSLVGIRGIRRMAGLRMVVYWHMLLPRHGLVVSNGAMTESFHPGPVALRLLGWRQRAEILRLFPALRHDPQGGYGPLARPALPRRAGAALAQRLASARGEPLAAVWPDPLRRAG